ncbi:hypothetical protein CFP56_012632 [Quercus suber]|uniref:Uncharacterized protein n=1 Tax=Quercus suber TaxID=58331 RepID=A0AAW0KVX8_QUESU
MLAKMDSFSLRPLPKQLSMSMIYFMK